MELKILGFGIAVVVGIFGSYVGGLAEDHIWLAAEGMLPNCESMGMWEQVCKKNNQFYYSAKSIFQLVGFIAPFITIFGLTIKYG